MGLDTTHGCWHGAYSAFMRWRVAVAKAAGIPLVAMEGFHRCPPEFMMQPRPSVRPSPMDSGELDSLQWWAKELDDVLPLAWDKLKPDIIHVLLNHSDCDGEIAAADCGPLADRLTELLPNMPLGDGGGHIGGWREKTQTFIDGLRLAASQNEPVGFH
jgi:hypothetical protein